MEFSQTVHNFCNKKLLFSNFGKQTSVSQILKKETPFVSTPLPFSLAVIKTTDVWRLVWMKRNVFSAFVLRWGLSLKFKKTKLLLLYPLVLPSSLTAYRKYRSVRCKSSNTTSYSAMWMLFVSHALSQKEFCWLQYYQKFSLWPINSTPSESEKNSFWASTKLPPYIYIINRNKEIKNKIIIFKNNDRQ